MNKQIGRISNYRETEKRINELETKLADEKKTLTSKRQEMQSQYISPFRL